MIIDCHTHLGQTRHTLSRKSGLATPEELATVQTTNGVDKCLVIPQPPEPRPESYLAANEYVLSLASEQFAPVVWINPAYLITETDRERYSELAASAKAIKLHPIIDAYYPDAELLAPVFELARTHGLPVMIHTGWGAFGRVMYVERVADAFPDVTLIIGHMIEEDCVEAAKRHDNTYLETSHARHSGKVRDAVRAIGAERILFGSDHPWANVAEQMCRVTLADIPAPAKDAILGGNAARLFGLG